MRLLRYREIERMLHVRTRKDPVTVPMGYGVGAWFDAIVDLSKEIDPAKFDKMTIRIGPKAVAKEIKVADIIDGEPGSGHLSGEITQEEYRALVKKMLAMVKVPEADVPEVAAAELEADRMRRDLEAANKRVEELEDKIARSQQSQ